MAISIKIAETPGDVDAVFRLRHQVYVEEEQRFAPQPGGGFFDRFDCFPSTRSILARDLALPGAPPVGTLRFASKTEVGLPCDSFFDFSPIIRELEGGIATVGMLAIARRFRHSLGVVSGMVKFAAREIRHGGGRHVVAPVSPDIEPVLRALGGQQVGDVIHHGEPPVVMTPLHIDMEALPPFFRETAADPQNPLFDRLNERRLFRTGETVIRQGDPGDEAFIVMRGRARLLDGQPEDGRLMGLLGPGQIIGDMALLDGGPRSASIVAHSRVLDVAVVPKEAFQSRLATDGDFCREMVRILGARARKAMLHLPPDSLLEYDQSTLMASVLLEVSAGGTEPVDRGWLAAECGLRSEQLETTVAAWEAAGVLRQREFLIDVVDVAGLLRLARPATPPQAPVRLRNVA